jgi:DNA polymerase III subunit epsilon
MESVLPLVIGTAVTCLVIIFAKILIDSGEVPLTPDQKLANPPNVDEQHVRTAPVARIAASVESSPAPMIAVLPAVERSERAWLATPEPTIPKCVAFFDVQTTGLSEKDRVVTFAGVKLLDTATLSTGSLQMAYIHLIFDPGRKSHPSAEATHGYSDWALRHQESFEVYAATIERFFDSADLVVAHNAEFDLGFYNREMERLGRGPIIKPTFCTRDGYRQKGFVGSASLSAICREIGVARPTKLHGALEDAWLAMRVYLWLNNRDFSGQLPPEFTGDPINMRSVPPLPTGTLPRRPRKKVVVAAVETGAHLTPPSFPPRVLQ